MRKFKTLIFTPSALAVAVFSIGCASGPSSTAKFDPKAAERAKPYLANHHGVDFRYGSTGGTCAEPKGEAEWKAWVAAAGTCVQKGDWAQLEKLGSEMSSRHMDSPWGAFFLGVAAAHRGEVLRAYWMFELSEKKAGGPMALVRYEKARILETQEGPSSAAKEMKEAVRLDPSLTSAQLWLAQVHHRDRLLSDAEKYYRQVLVLRGDVWPAIVGLADIVVEKGNGPEAVELLNKAISMKSDAVEPRLKLAHVYEHLQKDQAKALQTLRDLNIALERGRAKATASLDRQALVRRIQSIEQAMKPAQPVQAKENESAREPARETEKDAKRSQKKGG
jgi:tetratricopeptide (TPR) repeat protein